MADTNILSDFGINILEEEIDDVIFQTNEFLCDATFTGSQGPFWWILQMCMALAALFSIIVAAGMAYKMMVKHEPLDIMKLFKPLVVSIILCWWYPPADTGMTNSGSSWCVLDFLSYIPNCIGSYTHDLYEAESTQIEDKFAEVQELIYTRDTMYTALQAQADVAHTGTSDPNLIESTMEQAGVDEVTNMEQDASKLWFTSLTAGAVVTGISIPLGFHRVAGIFGRVLEAAVFGLELSFNLVGLFRVHGLQFGQEFGLAGIALVQGSLDFLIFFIVGHPVFQRAVVVAHEGHITAEGAGQGQDEADKDALHLLRPLSAGCGVAGLAGRAGRHRGEEDRQDGQDPGHQGQGRQGQEVRIGIGRDEGNADGCQDDDGQGQVEEAAEDAE